MDVKSRSRPFDEAPFRGGFHVDGNAVYQDFDLLHFFGGPAPRGICLDVYSYLPSLRTFVTPCFLNTESALPSDQIHLFGGSPCLPLIFLSMLINLFAPQ